LNTVVWKARSIFLEWETGISLLTPTCRWTEMCVVALGNARDFSAGRGSRIVEVISSVDEDGVSCLLSCCPGVQVTSLLCQINTYTLCTPVHQDRKPRNSSERQATCSNPWTLHLGYLSACFLHLRFLQLLHSCDQGNSSCSSKVTEWGNGFTSAVTAASVQFAYGRNLFVLL
jgi:hypothetical protein